MQPVPTRDELLNAGASATARVAAAATTGADVTPAQAQGADDTVDSAPGLAERLGRYGIGAMLTLCPAAKPDLTTLVTGLEAIADLAKGPRTSHAALAELREQHVNSLALSIQVVSARLYVALQRIRNEHSTVLPSGEAYDFACAVAKGIGERALGHAGRVIAVREGATFSEREMILAPGSALRPAGRVAPVTFAVNVASGGAPLRKAIVMPLDDPS